MAKSKPKPVSSPPKGKNPHGSLRAGRVSKVAPYLRGGQKGQTYTGYSVGPLPQDSASYKGAKPASLHDVVNLLKKTLKNNGGARTILMAYGDWYTTPTGNFDWNAVVIDVTGTLAVAQMYEANQRSAESLAEYIFDLINGTPALILHWQTAWKV